MTPKQLMAKLLEILDGHPELKYAVKFAGVKPTSPDACYVTLKIKNGVPEPTQPVKFDAQDAVRAHALGVAL